MKLVKLYTVESVLLLSWQALISSSHLIGPLSCQSKEFYRQQVRCTIYGEVSC